MQDFLSRISTFSPKRLALLADELNSRLEAVEDRQLGAHAGPQLRVDRVAGEDAAVAPAAQ